MLTEMSSNENNENEFNVSNNSETRSSRASQRRLRQNRRKFIMYQKRARLNVRKNNQQTVDDIVKLARQTTDDPLTNEFFNGISF